MFSNAGCKNAFTLIGVVVSLFSKIILLFPPVATISSPFTKTILSAFGVVGFVIGIVKFATKLLFVPAPFSIVPTTVTVTLSGTVNCVF